MHMTTNMGTAAYMAPELTSLIAYATEFPVQCEKELALRKKVLPFNADRETKLKEKLEEWALACPPFPTKLVERASNIRED